MSGATVARPCPSTRETEGFLRDKNPSTRDGGSEKPLHLASLCQTANQAVRVRIPANTNGFFLSVFLAPGGSEHT